MDQSRVEALTAYREVRSVVIWRRTFTNAVIQKMRTHENTSETLKSRASSIDHNPHYITHQGLSSILDKGFTERLQEDGGRHQSRAIRRSDYWGGHEAARR